MAKSLNVAMIGYKFMGKAHSNAWLNAPHFFQGNLLPVRKVVCGRNEGQLNEFAARWGWQETATDWRKVVERTDIDIVDIAVPSHLHHEIAIAAAAAGKHLFCEKPISVSLEHARAMRDAAVAAGVVHFLNHNYRRVPAVVLARQLINEGRIGRIFHWRGAYLQDWIVDPNFPLTWQLRQEIAGSGPHADLNSHSIDLARYLVGDIQSVSAMTAHFITERPLADDNVASAFIAGTARREKGKVTVEDAAFMLVQFANGALGAFEASRFATGRKNYNYFEIYGSKGSLLFNLERMNELQHFSLDDPAHAQGFRTIMVTEAVHPYISAWWPPGHTIGYEHEFTHAVVDFLQAIERGKPVEPNFFDGVKEMEVMEAALESARTGRKVEINQTKP
ncbi:MAG: Gfo/Idh/MocA family oxidoreductase [Candidatus Omnitrophica bacterium]|nr:Gfo/Idh/MocA family oxidoreductase [Candidatus Omnitrophota bacterium]